MIERDPPPLTFQPTSEEPVSLEMMKLLASNTRYSQQQLAAELGVSLGRAHYVLKAVLGRGWVKSKNFRRSDNKLGYLSVLTPTGVRRHLQLAKSFLAIEEAEYEALQREIAVLRREVAAADQRRSETNPESGVAVKKAGGAMPLHIGSGVRRPRGTLEPRDPHRKEKKWFTSSRSWVPALSATTFPMLPEC